MWPEDLIASIVDPYSCFEHRAQGWHAEQVGPRIEAALTDPTDLTDPEAALQMTSLQAAGVAPDAARLQTIAVGSSPTVASAAAIATRLIQTISLWSNQLLRPRSNPLRKHLA
jgi:hypothetical protein